MDASVGRLRCEARTTHRLGGWYERRHVLVVHHVVVVHTSALAFNGLKLCESGTPAQTPWFEPALPGVSIVTLIPPLSYIHTAAPRVTNVQRSRPSQGRGGVQGGRGWSRMLATSDTHEAHSL